MNNMISNDYILTKHAKARMKERVISENEVEEVLRNPDSSFPGASGEMKAEKAFKKGRKIRVVYTMERKRKKIITAVLID